MRNTARISALGAAIATALGVNVPGQVLAQQARAIEEIIVTARRREESLQQVPVAITAMTTADIEARNIDNVEQLNVLVPNVDIRGAGISIGGGNFTIRGVEGVARYIDGVVMNGDVGGLESIVELERIEVLRGPQGTYFGKNAIGGAIQYVSQKPLDDFGARIQIRIGEYDRQDVVANVDIPLSDTVKTKITAAQLQRDGYVDSVVVDESYGEQDDQVLRAQLEWTPSDNFEAIFTATSTRKDTIMAGNVLFDAVDDAGFGRNLPGTYQQIGLPFTDDLAFGLRDEWKNAVDYLGPGERLDSNQYIMDLTWDINDSLTFRSITNARDMERESNFDIDATVWGAFDWFLADDQEDQSQEFQLLGSHDRINWVVGLYYNEEDRSNISRFWQGIELEGFCGGNPVALPPGICPNLVYDLDRTIREDNAFFAEVTFDLTDQLTLTVGARTSTEDFRTIVFDPADGAEFAAGDIPPHTPTFDFSGTVSITPEGPADYSASFDSTTPRLALQYQFTDNVMGYVSYSEGFNGGGINNSFRAVLPNNGIIPFGSELLKNYEIGVRSDLLDGRLRLNATYFTGDWEDIQIGQVLVISTTTTTNAGMAEIDGLEIEGILRVTDNFALNLGYGNLHTEFTDVGSANPAILQVGMDFPFSPENTYNIGLQWDGDVGNGGSIMGRLDYGWIDDHTTFLDARFRQSAKGEAYGLLSGRLQYTTPDDGWTVALYGTNLTNEFYRMGGFNAILAGVDQGYPGRPREVGVQLQLNFD